MAPPDDPPAWHRDPLLAGFHPSYPDDLQVIVHDGEPRRTQRAPELCWVRFVGTEPSPPRPVSGAPAPTTPVYVATLLNAPHQLASVRAGDDLRVLSVPGLGHALVVTPAYLAERAAWSVTPCDRCGATECFDPPSVMIATRFPDAPAGAEMQAFSAFCICGGTQLLEKRAI